MAYVSQNANGNLYVSAPKGTGEAELFEDFAHLMKERRTVSFVLCSDIVEADLESPEPKDW